MSNSGGLLSAVQSFFGPRLGSASRQDYSVLRKQEHAPVNAIITDPGLGRKGDVLNTSTIGKGRGSGGTNVGGVAGKSTLQSIGRDAQQGLVITNPGTSVDRGECIVEVVVNG